MENLFFHVFCALVFLMALIKISIKYNQARSKQNLPPSPPKLPIIGNLHHLTTMPHLSLTKLAQKLGPILYLHLGEVPTMVVSSSAMAKEVMKTHDLAFSSRPWLYAARCLFYDCSDIVFSPYGDYWREVRKICVLELLSIKRVQSYGYIREEEASRLVQRILDSCSKITNLTKLLALYANDVLCRVVLGKNCSHGGEYELHGFQSMLNEYQELLGGFSVGDFFPSMEFMHFFTGHKTRLRRTFRRFDDFFNKMVEEHQSHGKVDENEKDLLDVLLDIQKGGDSEIGLTIDNVKAILLDMFAAGTDTTFITLDWGMTELIMNPQVMQKAQAEVRSITGDRNLVLETDLPKFHYLKAVLKEIFRLHPPVPVLVPRESIKDVNIAGYDIPAKTRVFVNAWAIGRDPESWENPEKFDPERFVGNTIDFKGRDFELLPFGAGRRGCPGISFGAVTVELVLAQLLHSFDWELPPGIEAGDLDLREAFGISMHKISDLLVVAKPHIA